MLRFAVAVVCVCSLFGQTKPSQQDLLKQAVTLQQQGKLEEAIRDYDLFLDMYPDASAVRSNWALPWWAVGRYARRPSINTSAHWIASLTRGADESRAGLLQSRPIQGCRARTHDASQCRSRKYARLSLCWPIAICARARTKDYRVPHAARRREAWRSWRRLSARDGARPRWTGRAEQQAISPILSMGLRRSPVADGHHQVLGAPVPIGDRGPLESRGNESKSSRRLRLLRIGFILHRRHEGKPEGFSNRTDAYDPNNFDASSHLGLMLRQDESLTIAPLPSCDARRRCAPATWRRNIRSPW